ncbi:hypothetical protein [Candidatus Agathobaculum pullicola]|uniref:hypothetical protein n=1 Tax=Candidatus Agathobaculum pullicola TaxID=2838426 RepID=UPI003F934AE1
MTIGGFQSNWFNVTTHTLENGNLLPIATVKDENKEEFAAYTKDLLEQLEQRNPSAGVDALTKEELKALNEKYDTDDMSYDEYQSFLRDLVDMGALTETDRWLAGGAKKVGDVYMTPVIPCMRAAVQDASLITPSMAHLSYDFPVGTDSVDITEWIKYRASTDMAYYLSGERYDLDLDELNQKMADILDAINRAD